MITPFYLIFLNLLSRKYTIIKNDSITFQKKKHTSYFRIMSYSISQYFYNNVTISGFPVLFLIFYSYDR